MKLLVSPEVYMRLRVEEIPPELEQWAKENRPKESIPVTVLYDKTSTYWELVDDAGMQILSP